MDECGDVHIHFPAEGSKSDIVIIRGVKEDVEKAKKQLLEMASDSEKQLAERQLSSCTTEVRAKPEYHRYIIGRGGANITKVCHLSHGFIMISYIIIIIIFFVFFLVTPLTGHGTDPEVSGSPANC